MCHSYTPIIAWIASFMWVWYVAVAVCFVAVFSYKIWLTWRKEGGGRPINGAIWLLFLFVPVATNQILFDWVARDVRCTIFKYIEYYLDVKIYASGKEVENPEIMLSSLKGISGFNGHHSHVVSRYNISIQSNGRDKLELILGQDSDFSNEYWIFYPKFPVTRTIPVGQIRF